MYFERKLIFAIGNFRDSSTKFQNFILEKKTRILKNLFFCSSVLLSELLNIK